MISWGQTGGRMQSFHYWSIGIIIVLFGGVFALYQFGNAGNNPSNYGNVWNWLTNTSGN